MENETNYNLQKVEDNFAYDQYKKSKNAKWKILIFIIIGILILGGLGYAGYWGYNKYIAQTPEKVLIKSFEKMQNIEILSYEGKIILNTPIDQSDISSDKVDLLGSLFSSSQLDASLVFVGAFDRPDFNNSEDKMKMDIDLSVGDMFTFGAQIVGLDDVIYFNFNKIPVMLAMFVDLSSIKDQWIKYESNKPLETNLDLSEINQDKEEFKKVLEVFSDNLYKIIIIKEDLGVEEISDAQGKVYHYKLGLDKNGIEKLMEGIKLVVSEERQKSIDEDLKNIKDEDWEKIIKGEVDVWIGKKDYYLKKIIYNTTLSQDEKEIKLNFGLLFKDFNQPVIIEIPEESISAEEFLQNVMGGLMGGLFKNEISPELKDGNENSFDSPEVLDSDADGLTDEEENNIWGTDPNNPDTDTDGYTDGQEVQNGYNPNGEGKLE